MIFGLNKEITDEVVTGKGNSDLSEYLEDIIKNAESNGDNIKVGYYRLSNGNFVNPFEYKEGTIIGVVAYFDSNDNPVCVGVNFKILPWMKRTYLYYHISSDISYDDSVKDMDGMKHTKSILSSKDYNPYNFVAVKYCKQYSTEGTKRGDWYLPAIGECLKIAQNILVINASLSKAGFDTIDTSYRLWSSSEHSERMSSYVWYCDMLDADCYYYDNSEVGTVVCMLKC